MNNDEYLIPNQNYNRLYNEYKKYNSLVVAFDFDNTVYDYHNIGCEYKKVKKLLIELKNIGCTLICFTANENLELVNDYLKNNNIKVDKINDNPDFYKSNSRKIYYNVLLDDRAGLIQTYKELNKLVKTIKTEKQCEN